MIEGGAEDADFLGVAEAMVEDGAEDADVLGVVEATATVWVAFADSRLERMLAWILAAVAFWAPYQNYS